MDTFFALTTLNIDGEYRSRLVGCFPDFESALKCVLENHLDIYEEGWYPYAVIEKLDWGLYPNSIANRWFYQWQGAVKGRPVEPSEGYVACDPLPGSERLISYFG